METPTNLLKRKVKFLLLLPLYLLIAFELKSQDMAVTEPIVSHSVINSKSDIDYPECPDPTGIVRYEASTKEIVYFKEEINSSKYYYELRLIYNSSPDHPILIKVNSGSSYSIDYTQYNIPDEVEIRRVCHSLRNPFIYESDWILVPLVQSSRTSGDTICDQFNGATFTYDPDNHIYDFECLFDIRGSFTNVRVLLEVDYCTAQDSSLYIYSFPFAYSAGSNEVCAMTMTLQYQTANGQWHQCDEIVVYESDNNFVSASCDGDHDDVIIDDSTYLTTLVGVDVIYVGGFAVRICNLTGPLSGKGIIRLPFQDKDLVVEFDSIDVNQDHQVVHVDNGSYIAAISAGTPSIPSSNLSSEEERCIKPQDDSDWNSDSTNVETGELWDVNGFCQNGQYCKEPPYPGYQPGDPFDPNYDPCGFDANGIHRDTGKKYNSDGCSRDSLNKDGQHCVLNCIPYYWLQNPEVTEAGLAFYDSVKAQLPNKVDSLLEVLENEIESALSAKVTECAGLVHDMRDIVSINQIDSISIFGVNSEYIRPGLAERFVRKPEPFKVHMERDGNIKNLENLHIQLYECDALQSELEKKLEILQSIVEDTSGLMIFLANRIKTFTQSDVNALHSNNAWMLKLKELIKQYIDQVYKEQNGIGYNYPSNNKKFDLPNLDSKDNEVEDLHLISNAFIGTVDVPQNAFEPNLVGGACSGNVLPLDINVGQNGEIATITITRIGFHPEYLTVDAFMRVDNPLGSEQLVFSCHDVQFSPHGLFEEGKLSIADTNLIKIFNVANLILLPENTFVEWDCSGFKELSIDGYIEFCRNAIIPLDSITQEPLTEGDKKVKAFFQTDITSFGDFFAELNVEPFAVASQPNIRFEVDSAYLDFSTSISPDITMPLGYTNENCAITGTNQTVPTPFWEGFYLGHLKAKVVTGALGNNGSDFEIDVRHAVIDDRGFSAFVRIANPIAALDTSNIGKWPFSIEGVRLHFLFNNLIGGGFDGYINVPIFRGSSCSTSGSIVPADCFQYTADYLSGGTIQFSITPTSQMCVPLWKGKVVLDSNTVVTITKNQSDFIVEAKLFGYADFDSLKYVHVDSARFENLILRNKAPYFSTGNWYVKDIGFNIGGFGMSLKDISLDTIPGEEDKAKLNFIGGIEINADYKVSAYGGFSAISKIVEVNNRQKWTFNNISVNSLFVDADIKNTHISGYLKYFENSLDYGKGFKAAVKVKFARIGDAPGVPTKNEKGEPRNDFVSIAAAGLFGSKGTFQYFTVDALAHFKPGIPLGAMTIRALGGGISYNMVAQDSLLALPVNMNVPTDSASVFSMVLGSSLTGATFLPDDSKDLGLKIILAGAIKDEKICSFNGVFQVLFNHSGIAYAGIKGTVRLMVDSLNITDLPLFPDSLITKVISEEDLKVWTAPNITASIKGYFAIAYTAPTNGLNGSLQGNIAVYMNAGDEQNPFIYGKALAEVFIGKDDWYFNLGRLRNDPKGRAELTIDLAMIRAQVKAYLNIGTKIPPIPDPPKPIYDLFGSISSPDAALGWGTGFAFGVGVDVNLDIDLTFGSIEIDAGYGFDLAIKRYENAQCANTGSQIGINGWYASGQAYLYLNGTVKLLGADIVDIATGVIVQAGFPNPTWVKGRMRLKYKLLFIKGNISAKIEFGEQCIPEAEEGSELPLVIYSVLPMSGSTGVDVLSSIDVDFNLPMDQTIKYTSGENSVTYTTKIDSIELKSASGFKIPVVQELEDGNQHAIYTPQYTLPPNDSFTFVIRVKVFKEGVELTELDGVERIVGFRTGEALPTIPARNIQATYPIHGMNNFYRNEYEDQTGYVLLVRNQYELMTQTGDERLSVILSSPTHHYIGLATYYSEVKAIYFPLPASQLEQGEMYQVELTKAKGLESLSPNELTDLSNNDYDKLKKMWKAVFRISNYESLFDKVEALRTNMDLDQTLSFEDFYENCTSYPIEIDEPFDEKEVKPVSTTWASNTTNTLIKFAVDVNELKTKDEYAAEWDWLNNILNVFVDPILTYLNPTESLESNRYEAINGSVYIGSACGYSNDNLQSSLDFSNFDNLSGYAVMEGILEPAQMGDVETIEGNEVNTDNGPEIAASQNLVISTPNLIGGMVTNNPSHAQYLIDKAVTECLKHLNQGRSARDITQPCKGASLVPVPLYDLSLYSIYTQGYPYTGNVIRLPIIMTYNLPGTDFQTSIHRFILTYNIN